MCQHRVVTAKPLVCWAVDSCGQKWTAAVFSREATLPPLFVTVLMVEELNRQE